MAFQYISMNQNAAAIYGRAALVFVRAGADEGGLR